MKNLLILSATIIIIVLTSCNNQTKTTDATYDSQQIASSEGIQVYYFHYSRRCNTCMAVEEVTSNSIKEMYGQKVKFQSLNLDESEVEKFANTMKINGQALVVVSDTTQIDLTNEGFMFALDDPEKLKDKLKTTIDNLL